MKEHAPSRRDFLCGTGFVAMGLATGGSMILAPDHAWAMSPLHSTRMPRRRCWSWRTNCSRTTAGRSVLRHRGRALDKQAASDAALRKLLVDGVARLDAAHGMPWVDLSDGARNAVLKTRRPRVLHHRADARPSAACTAIPKSIRCSATAAPRWSSAATSTAASTTSAGCPTPEGDDPWPRHLI